MLADLRAIPGSAWFMVAKVDASEILAEARYRGEVVAVFAVLFVMLAASVTAFGYRYRQARLYQDLYRSERHRREAQEKFRITLYSIGDAVITTDTRGQVEQMNPVAERLTGWLEQEAKGKPLHDVFPRGQRALPRGGGRPGSASSQRRHGGRAREPHPAQAVKTVRSIR